MGVVFGRDSFRSVQSGVESEDLAGLFEVMPIGLASIRLSDCSFTATNAVFRRLFRIPDDRMHGLSILDFYPKEDLPLVREWFADIRTHTPHLVEITRRYINFEGNPFDGFAYGWLTEGPDGKAEKLVGAFFDVGQGTRSSFVTATARRRERLARAQLARETANDLNNALAQLTVGLEAHLGPMETIPAGLSAAISRTMNIARRLLVLGWGTAATHSAAPGGSPVESEVIVAREFETVLNSGPMRIVVVEDSGDLREQVVESLRIFGHLAVGASNGAEAITLLEEIDANRALIDLRLELESGRDVAEQLRQLKPNLPVVYMTGYASLSTVESGTNSDPVVMKPFKVADVVDTLRAVGTGFSPVSHTGGIK